MNEDYVQKLGEALILLSNAVAIIKKVQIEISSELARLESGENGSSG